MTEAAAARPGPTGALDLFLTFSAIAATGYGGTLAWTHRALVEKKRWLTHEEFAEQFAVGQILPGPNICNFAAMLGYRHAGLSGALAAVAGLIAFPLLLMMALGAAYAAWGALPAVERALHGMACVSAGLVVATGIKMTRGLGRRPSAWSFAILAFVAMGIVRWPLLAVLALLAPFALVHAWRRAT